MLPTAKIAPARVSPRFVVLYGKPKSGKTTKLAQLDNCLIIDTEQGTDYIEAMKVNVTGLGKLHALVTELEKPDAPKYDYIAIDTLSKIVEWTEAYVVKEAQKTKPTLKTINEVGGGYGAGMKQQRDIILPLIGRLEKVAVKGIIVCAHLRRNVANDTDTTNSEQVDLFGSLRSPILQKAQAIGLNYWGDEDSVTKERIQMISFKQQEGVLDFDSGSRCNHLKNQAFPFEWDKIFID